MVSFTSITQGVFLISAIMIASSLATPSNGEQTQNVDKFSRPSYIPSRTQLPIMNENSDELFSERNSMEENIQRMMEKGINFTNMTENGTIKSIIGMALEMPENIPSSRLDITSNQQMILATPDQVKTFELYSGVASTIYCQDLIKFGSWSCANCMKYIPDGKVITSFEGPIGNVAGMIIRSDEQKTIHIIIRGGSSISNTLVDLIVEPIDYEPVKGSKVHAGMYLSYKEIVDKYFPYVQEQLTINPHYKIVVSGHSVGGAGALFVGLDLFQRESRISPNNLSIYAAGCPRVGDPAFAHYVASTGVPFYRTVHNRDVIPHIPTQEMGYLHPGIEIWEVPGEGVHICPIDIESKHCSNSIVPFTHIIDHASNFGVVQGVCY